MGSMKMVFPILINLLNFSKRKHAENYFDGWKKEYIVGLGVFYEENSLTVSVNLTKKEVSMR